MMARFCDIWILSPLKKKKKKRCQSSDPDQIRLEFRKECFVNLNIWACDRKHAKRQYCRISDYVVQKPMRTRSICKYHLQHPTDTWYFSRLKEIRMQALVSLPPSLSPPLAKPNQGQTGIPRINNESERPTLRPMPRKNVRLCVRCLERI